jgi:hypothetical protein
LDPLQKCKERGNKGDINESGLPSAKGFKPNNLGRNVSVLPQECKERAWGHIGAAWRSVAWRVVQVSTLRNYARCHIQRWYGVTRLAS